MELEHRADGRERREETGGLTTIEVERSSKKTYLSTHVRRCVGRPKPRISKNYNIAPYNRQLGSLPHAPNILVILEGADGRKQRSHSVTASAQSHPSAPAGGSMGHLWA